MSLFFALLVIIPQRGGIDVSFYQVPHGTLQTVIFHVSIPHQKLLFEIRDDAFEASFEVDIDIKEKNRVVLSDFWPFRERARDYKETQEKSLKATKTLTLKAPNREEKLHWTLVDLISHSVIADSEFQLEPIHYVSSLIPLEYHAFQGGRKEILPPKTLDGKVWPLVFFRIEKRAKEKVEGEFGLKRIGKPGYIWQKKRTYAGPFPDEDTLLISLDSLFSGSYILEANFKFGLKEIKRELKFTYFNLNRLLDKDYKTIVDIISYIATPNEIKEFKNARPEKRKLVWEKFWEKRDPTPGTPQNEFEEEFLERVEYVNEHFSYGNWPGYRTDRGMIYIKLGPPDDIESHPFDVNAYPYEIWYYYTLNLQFLFVDKSGIGEYELVYPVDYRSRM